VKIQFAKTRPLTMNAAPERGSVTSSATQAFQPALQQFQILARVSSCANSNPAVRVLRATWLFLLFVALAFPLPAGAKPQSPIVSVGRDRHLIYYPDERGNRIPDFSHCGYAGGDRPIPNAPVKVVVPPVKGDETARIQKAIDYVASLPADAGGLRGAVLLLKGRHEVFGGLFITNSGVVLRGQGMGTNGTILVAAGEGRRTLIRIFGQNDRTVRSNSLWEITDSYLPVGAISFHVKDATGLKVGDTIDVVRPCTQAWIDRLGMTEFGGGFGDWRLVWHPGSHDLIWDRIITAIDGNRVTVDAPITTALDTRYGGGYVQTYSWPGRIHNVGVENLRLESAFNPSNPKDESHSWMAITMENTDDAWVRQVTAEHFAGSLAAIYEACKWVTVEDCMSLAPVSEIGGYRRDTFFTMGQMTLFLRCWAEHGRHDFSVGYCAPGPNAFVQCEDYEALADSGPIDSWASGVLYDNVRIDGNALTLGNRHSQRQGAGWAAANCVAWQCDAAKITCENPPTAQNWAFGSWAEFDGDGIWRHSNEFVRPRSLYVAQVADRLGPAAAARIPLMSRFGNDSSNPSIQEAAKLAAESTQPGPKLSDYIAAATQRDPISCEPGNAKNVDEIPETHHASRITHHLISITNGWLVCDGKLLIGRYTEINWWRGNMRPDEAPKFGINLTRFAPGRIGPGLTDNLKDVANGMIAKNQVALDYHYGLWYDRRRESHERVREMNGNVWAPFYVQPFERSGQGTAWDGLSKYDLTKYNPWYWNRLKKFADICDQRGLVLFNENYFQHNVLEAGAHWVDCPWRSVNNINHTGFPEPPPFAGDKRIFMAPLFYDTNNPVRRALHQAYIRQCLNNFTNNANVIQFTSGEFTGPSSFEQFWLETIGNWERETGHKELIALAAPKNVQDGILADPKLSAVVNVICFRYWWQTDKGLFAPKGGENLSPRQFERRWTGGAPTDSDLATMASEYRPRFPDKAIIACGEDVGFQGSWAFVCAGGSIPALPQTTDKRLLAAIPQMQPWQATSNANCRVLREPGKQYLVWSSGGSGKLDLSAESGSFQERVISLRTGEVIGQTKMIQAGSEISLPEGVVWLVKEN
jgi:Family of unknown function (DUF6298)